MKRTSLWEEMSHNIFISTAAAKKWLNINRIWKQTPIQWGNIRQSECGQEKICDPDEKNVQGMLYIVKEYNQTARK